MIIAGADMSGLRNRFKIRIAGKTAEGDYTGIIEAEELERPISFAQTAQMVVALEDLLERRNFPKAAVGIRTFGKRREQNGANEMELLDKNEQNKDKATFVVTVLYRQNATWQGTLKWLEGGKEEKFRSALELIKLMDSAVEQTDEE